MFFNYLVNNDTLVPGPRKADKNVQEVHFTRVLLMNLAQIIMMFSYTLIVVKKVLRTLLIASRYKRT